MITVSLETAKKMKDAGWNKQTQFRYCFWWDWCKDEFTLYHEDQERISYTDYYEAPTAQEILDELPSIFIWEWYWESCWIYVNWIWVKSADALFEWNLAENLAQLRLRCKENNYLPTSN